MSYVILSTKISQTKNVIKINQNLINIKSETKNYKST